MTIRVGYCITVTLAVSALAIPRASANSCQTHWPFWGDSYPEGCRNTVFEDASHSDLTPDYLGPDFIAVDQGMTEVAIWGGRYETPTSCDLIEGPEQLQVRYIIFEPVGGVTGVNCPADGLNYTPSCFDPIQGCPSDEDSAGCTTSGDASPALGLLFALGLLGWQSQRSRRASTPDDDSGIR